MSKVKAQVGECKNRRSVLQLKCSTLESRDIKTLYLLKSSIVHRIVYIGSLVEHFKSSSYPLESVA
jgi:hypothetical protein